MEIGEKGAFVNEVSQDFIGIAGSGEIALPVKSGRSLTIKQFGEVERGIGHSKMTKDFIFSEISIGGEAQYGDFISATVTSLAPGTVVFVEPNRGPRCDTDYERKSGQLAKPLRPLFIDTKLVISPANSH